MHTMLTLSLSNKIEIDPLIKSWVCTNSCLNLHLSDNSTSAAACTPVNI